MSEPIRAYLAYPRVKGNADTVIVALLDVRAADNLVIRYDFDRDGWTIALEDNPDHEQAFIPAWGDEAVAPDPRCKASTSPGQVQTVRCFGDAGHDGRHLAYGWSWIDGDDDDARLDETKVSDGA